MNSRYLYLLLDLASLSIPLVCSFYPKAPFYKAWKQLIPALMITAIIFLFWDIQFTEMGVWGFNSKYITGINLFNLPIEEVLFFICIPYACTFIYFAIDHLAKDTLSRYQYLIADIIMVASLVVGFMHLDSWYTSTTLIALGVMLILLSRVWRVSYLGKFFLSFLITLIPFFVVNGILTGSLIEEEVVWYNNSENLGIRMGTIPIEDAFYGMLLLLMNVALFEYFKSRSMYRNEK